MRGFLISYISPKKGACVDFQMAKNMEEALELHLKYFPKSKLQIIKEMVKG